MKLFTYRLPGQPPAIAVRRGDADFDLRSAVQARLGEGRDAERRVPAEMTALIEAGGLWDPDLLAAAAEPGVPPLDADGLRLLAPLPRPGKIIGVGRNYGAHAAEGGLERQEQPRLFAMLPNSVIGPADTIPKPPAVSKLDWEIELAVVVGRRMKAISEADVLSHVAGYTILNDVSAREFQFDVTPPQTTFAKSMDGFTPIGPVLVSADEFGDPKGVGLRCWVDGELMQEGNTNDLIFSVPYVLSYVSRYMTLMPGDVIATGTPAGVGHFRDPPVYLEAGSVVRMEVDRIGVLENRVVAAGEDR